MRRTPSPDRAAFADGTRINSPLFFDGVAIFKSIRLQVNGKTVDPGPALSALAEPPDDAGVDAGSVPGASLPPGFAPDPNVNITEKGMTFRDEPANSFTTASDYLDKDFTLDVVYDFTSDEWTTLQVGIGNTRHDEDRSLHADANCPRKDGTLQFGDFRIHTWDVGSLHHDHTGPDLIRLQKRGDTLTMAVCVDYKDKFTPDFFKVIPSIKALAPMINRTNAFLFGAAGMVERARLIVDGQPLPQVAEAKPDTAPVANLIRLTGPELPTFLEPHAHLRFGVDGVSVEGKAIRTSRADLANVDFCVDLLIHPPSGGGGMMRIGYGAEDRSANANWVDQSVYLDFAGNSSIELATTHMPETIAHFNDPGPHLVRLRKTGNTLTFSVCLDYQGKFEPDMSAPFPISRRCCRPSIRTIRSCSSRKAWRSSRWR